MELRFARTVLSTGDFTKQWVWVGYTQSQKLSQLGKLPTGEPSLLPNKTQILICMSSGVFEQWDCNDRVYGIWAKYRLPITGRPDIETVLAEKKSCKIR